MPPRSGRLLDLPGELHAVQNATRRAGPGLIEGSNGKEDETIVTSRIERLLRASLVLQLAAAVLFRFFSSFGGVFFAAWLLSYAALVGFTHQRRVLQDLNAELPADNALSTTLYWGILVPFAAVMLAETVSAERDKRPGTLILQPWLILFYVQVMFGVAVAGHTSNFEGSLARLFLVSVTCLQIGFQLLVVGRLLPSRSPQLPVASLAVRRNLGRLRLAGRWFLVWAVLGALGVLAVLTHMTAFGLVSAVAAVWTPLILVLWLHAALLQLEILGKLDEGTADRLTAFHLLPAAQLVTIPITLTRLATWTDPSPPPVLRRAVIWVAWWALAGCLVGTAWAFWDWPWEHQTLLLALTAGWTLATAVLSAELFRLQANLLDVTLGATEAPLAGDSSLYERLNAI